MVAKYVCVCVCEVRSGGWWSYISAVAWLLLIMGSAVSPSTAMVAFSGGDDLIMLGRAGSTRAGVLMASEQL
ncbi:hypothetical protein C8Q73DRAFT_90970 [Cubamyces lactineus]|nr:hypothetical protein C8Q73DRAFT_90970 [Cubamyces lactineus]